MKWLSLLFGAVASLAGVRGAAAEPRRILATDDVHDCSLAEQGRVLAATSGGLVLLDERGSVRVLTALDGLPDTRIDGVRARGGFAEVETRAGNARVSVTDFSVKALAVSKDARASRPEPSNASARGLPAGVTVRASQSLRARRCIATDHGLFVARDAEPLHRVALLPALPTGDVSALASGADRLFIGTFDHGLYIARGSTLTRVEGGLNVNVNALAWEESEGTLWVGSARGLSRCRLDSVTGLACRRVGQTVAVHALLLARGGGVWAGTEQGLSLFDRAGTERRSFGAKQHTPFRAVWALAESESSELYIGTASGLYWAKTPAFIEAASGDVPKLSRASLVSGELADDWVTAILAERGTLAVGTYNAGIASFRSEASRLIPTESDESLGYVNSAGIARLANGELAVSTMDGLRIGAPGRFRTLKTLGRDVTGLLASADPGEYWIATRRGLEQRRLEP